MERGRGFEPPRPAWKAGMLAVKHQPRMMGLSFLNVESPKQSFSFIPFIPSPIFTFLVRERLVFISPIIPTFQSITPPVFKCISDCFIITNVVRTKILFVATVGKNVEFISSINSIGILFQITIFLFSASGSFFIRPTHSKYLLKSIQKIINLCIGLSPFDINSRHQPLWSRRRDSNPYAALATLDFKSKVSTSSTTPGYSDKTH